MSSFKLTYPIGATPLDSNEIEGLIPDYITTQKELNILEQQNIVEGMNWTERNKNSDILSITFCSEANLFKADLKDANLVEANFEGVLPQAIILPK